VSKTERHT